VINTYSKVLGRTVRPMTIDKKMLFKSLKAMGFDMYQFINVTHYMDELEHGAFSSSESLNNLVLELTGKKAENFETILRRELKQTGYDRRTLLSSAKAMLFFAKIIFTRAPDLASYEKQQNLPAFFNAPVLSCQNSEWAKEHLSTGTFKSESNVEKNQPIIQAVSIQ
jgi:hypothetical protein